VQYVLESATACKTAGLEFLAYLDMLLNKSSSSNLFHNVQASLRFHLKVSKVEEFAIKLDRLRGVLMLATTLALRTSSKDQHTELMSHLQALRITKETEDSGAEAAAAAIQVLIDTIQQQATSSLSSLQAHVDQCISSIEGLRSSLPHEAEQMILHWLSFRQRLWRYEEVPLAYRKTFEWIFEHPSCVDQWSDFSHHLSDHENFLPYLIMGKAGSGKSTLMKFVVEHWKTKPALARWAGPSKLLTLRFFFWNLGTALQKNIAGMLRSLLHGVLSQYPELIPAVLPDFYQHVVTSAAAAVEPSYTELKKALELLREKSSKFLKICIFIDGIDELEGDHRDLSLFLRGLASPHIKLVISSRPINACINALQGCPSLRLQDLTRSDMATFIEGELCAHPLMVNLSKLSPVAADNLVAEIRDMAEGVFLWVSLVVRLLVDGLENGDDMSDLLRKLRSLPTDLAALYQRMMNRMSPEYRGQAAEIFQLQKEWRDVTEERPFPALVLATALQQPSRALHTSLAPNDHGVLQWAAQSIEARIRSRCCGLLEVHRRPAGPEDSFGRSAEFYGTLTDLAVEYLHRTVAEFLVHPDVWSEVCSAIQQPDFDPAASLALASLAMMKAAFNFWDPPLLMHLKHGVGFIKRSVTMTADQLQQYMNQIDETMEQFFLRSKYQQTNCHWSVQPEIGIVPRTCGLIDDLSKDTKDVMSSHSNIQTFAAQTAVHKYLRVVLQKSQTDYNAQSALMMYAMESWIATFSSGSSTKAYQRVTYGLKLADMAETLQLLLTDLVPPEGHCFGLPVASTILRLGESLRSMGKLLELAEMLRVFFAASRTPTDLAKRINGDLNHRGELAKLIGAITSCGDLEVSHIGLDIKRMTSIDNCESSESSPARPSTQPLVAAHPPAARRYFLHNRAAPTAHSSQGRRKRREQASSGQDSEQRPRKAARRE
jgi:hypothetical protein